ncbi:ATP-dependent RNA helicase HrpA [Demequina sp. SO4-18]|uniref:ATP-dependent RNA helicase HrpA n=1 Tax=Demequina sp. SO4-18 TaxID=3401026 RepID=UPI003B5CAB35
MSDESPRSTPAGHTADAGAASEVRSGSARRRSGRRRGRGRGAGAPATDSTPRTGGADNTTAQDSTANTGTSERGRRSQQSQDTRGRTRQDRDGKDRAQNGRSAKKQGGRSKGGDPHRPVSRAALESGARAREAVELAPIEYPEQLPVSASREEISNAIRDHQVVIVAGETGSGKTTQLPKIVLELGRGRAGQIGHTQPRRIAARTVAERIAEELGTPLGEIVGYQVRFTDESSERTLVKVMTDGILLAQIQRDPELLAYDTLIIDEAHERSLNIDFLLGYLTNLLPRRPDLKVIITSATIDSDRFARHFAPGGPLPPPTLDEAADPAPASSASPTAPVIEVTGRTYPVEIRYRPLEGDTRGEERDLVTGIIDACDELMSEGPGDILAFLSGEREIRDAADALAGSLGPRARDPRHPQAVEIIPLYSRLSSAEQHKVFERHSSRRIVLATNVAETSLTVPGIHYVVDPGTARISRYSKATKVQRLPIEPISQASANQRAGRAGRLADGIAIRLYAEDDFAGRPEFTEPEILRTSLASVLLQMISVGVVSGPEDMARFPFVEPPDTRAIRDGVQLLTELGALDTDDDGRTRLTPTGRTLSRLPMDPRQARMIVEAQRHGVAREVAIIAAGLSIQDPRERPSEEREKADQLHRRFAEPASDLLSYLNLWEYLREQRHELSGSAFRRMCRAEHLNFLRVREWQDVVEQIRQTAKPLGIDMARKDARPLTPAATGDAEDGKPAPDSQSHRYVWDADAIHRSILAGLLSQLGMQETGEPKASQFAHLRGGAREAAIRRAKKQSRNDYLGARGARFAIFPGSPLSKKPPAFVMAAELVETSRLWARDVAAIKPEWAEELAGDLAKRTYADPHWSKKRGAAVATEKVLLYGVPIVADRDVLWGRIRPTEARDLFIRHALVQGEWETHHSFWKDNQRLLAEAEELEARSRTRGLLADDDALFDFYDERVPDSVVSARHFDRWWKDERRRNPELLTLTLDTVAPEHADVDTDAFPTVWPQGDLELPLTYQFEPGTDADGVTAHIPIAVLARVAPEGFDWMVPGLADELATATIRALPKTVRRLLVPAPDTARDVAAWMERETPAWEDMARAGDMAEGYRDVFTRAVRDTRGVDVPADAWDGIEDRLPAHLRMTFRVEDEDGSTVDESTDLVHLQRTLAPQSQAAVSSAMQRSAAPRSSVQRAADAARDHRDRQAQRGREPGDGAHPGDDRIGAGTPAPGDARPSAAALPEQSGLTTWPELPGGALPDEVSGEVGGATVRGYPAIVDEGQAALRVLADQAARGAAHAAGVRRLLATECALPVKRITTRWTAQTSLTLGSSPYRSTEALVAALQDAAVRSLTAGPDVDAAAVRDAEAYGRARDHVRASLEDETFRIAGLAAAALDAYRDLDGALTAATSMALLAVVSDIRAQADALVGDGFLARTPTGRLAHLSRYLRAASMRLEKAKTDPNRDAATMWKIRDVTNEVTSVREAHEAGRPDPERADRLDHARWMIEELRVSLFAQTLGTSEPVSEKRIRALLA